MRQKQIYFESELFSLENGLLNQTMKFRAEVKYREVVVKMYEEGPLQGSEQATPRL